MAQHTTNSSTLSWPYSSLGNLPTNTGSNNHSHESTATWVYLPGQIPNPWPYLLASWIISFAFTAFGWISSAGAKKDEKPPWKSKFRIPGISFNMFRCIVAVVKVARIKHTKLVPSHVTNTGCALSLITSFSTWDKKLDLWSVVAAIGTTAFWSLNISQLTLSFTAEYGFGKMRIDGGNCPRKLIGSEKCGALEFIGCSELPQVPVLEDLGMIQTEAGGFGVTMLIALCSILWMWFSILRWKKERPFGTTIMKGFATVTLLILFWMFTGMYSELKSTSYTYVDSMGGKQLDSNTTQMSEVLWSDCFDAFEPRKTDGFFMPWATDVWNDSKESALRFFAVI
ncbi:hypothetical protein VF21_10601 [Pseudogymnoascus sp. 05NY08]|nr:hypothetical protein VF21_10601 [Pseudogymnoascus sp. 05NY08]